MVMLDELAAKLDLRQLTDVDVAGREVSDGCVCDLLSWVMARGHEGMVWVTVQTHLNVVAVACLHDFACVIIPENIEVPQTTIERANGEALPIYSTPSTSYDLCCGMYSLGVGR